MSRLTLRETQIIKLLLKDDQSLTSVHLSNVLGVSSKTIRNDIANINQLYQTKVITSTNKGFVIRKGIVAAEDFEESEDSAIVNVNTIIEKLVLVQKMISYNDLADELNISESYLQKWIVKANVVLVEFDLEIQRQKGNLILAGSEFNIRRLINAMIKNELNQGFGYGNILQKYYNKLEEHPLLESINQTLDNKGYYIAPYYITTIYLNLLSSIDRITKQNRITEQNNTSQAPKEETIEFEIGLIIAQYIEEHHHINIDEEEFNFMTSLFYGQIKLTNAQEEAELDMDFRIKIKAILEESFKYYMLKIDYDDFLYVFSLHVFDLIKRSSSSFQVPNYYLDSIRDSCPYIYDVAVHICSRIEKEFKVTLYEGEISLIAIHIGYSIDNSLQAKSKIKGIIVSAPYHHINRTVIHKIINKFRDTINIQDSIQSDNILELSSLNPETLYITTIQNLPVRDNICRISPIVSNHDVMSITNAISYIQNQNIMFSLRSLMIRFTHPKYFYTHQENQTMNNIIDTLSEALIKDKLVDQGFKNSIYAREKMSSTCFFDRFAFPHALELNAKKTMIAIEICDQPIQWGNQQISCVFLICINQEDQPIFSKLYDGLIAALTNDHIFQAIKTANTYDEFIQCF